MDETGQVQADRLYVEAMRAEVDWAPLHFDGWGHYEQARPAMPGETIEVIARWPDEGYTLQYRPMLGELTEARQYPIEPFPTVTVLGSVEEQDIPELRALAAADDAGRLAVRSAHVAVMDRTIPTEPPVRTGSSIPAHAEIPVHYSPTMGGPLKSGCLIHNDHPSVAYAVGGHWNLRLGRPVGLTPTGLLVFQPIGMGDVRLTIEHPVKEPVGPYITDARVGIYRHDGLGGWHQTAAVTEPDELQRLARGLMVPMSRAESRHSLFVRSVT